jgi:tRNA pseudouridine38-40 synthase
VEDIPTKIVLILEYDGTEYFGFQLQAGRSDQPTIQFELEKAIKCLTGEELRVLAASRTDTGVHAKGQVVSFKTVSSLPTRSFMTGLNHYLPKNIAVISARKADITFNVRSDAVSREYSYYMLNRDCRTALKYRYCYHVPEHLEIQAMKDASKSLIGEHDFASFTNNLGSRIKTMRKVTHSQIETKGDVITFNITANSYLPHQIRNTVGSLLQVGLGKMNVGAFCEMMNAKKPGLAGPRVPSRGLFLMRVNYSRPFGEEK